MAQLWPDPKTVLSNSPSATSPAPGSSLWPDPAKILGKPNNLNPKPVFNAPSPAASIPDAQSKLHTPGSLLGDVGQGLKTGGKMVGDFFKQYAEPFKNPSDTEQKIEQQVLPTSNNKILNTIQAPARFVIKGATRALEPMAEGLGNQVANIILDKKTAKSLSENPQVQTIGHQAQPQFNSGLKTSNATPEDYVATVINSANVALPIAGMLTDFFGMAGDKLATRGSELKVTPDQISTVLKSDTQMPPQARIILEHLSEKGQGFEMQIKRPAGGLRQTIGEALGGTAEKAYTFEPTGDVNPQIKGPEPFAHESTPQALALKENGAEIQPFAHEAAIPEQRVSPFIHETTGAMGGANQQIGYRGQAVGAEAGQNGYTFYTSSPELAKQYAGVSKPVVGSSEVISKDLTGLNLKEVSKSEYLSEVENPSTIQNYDGIKFKSNGADNFALFEKPSSGGSMSLNAELVPGLSKTISEDIIPKAKGVVSRASDIYHEIAALVNPTGQAPKEALDIIMKNKGDFEKTIFRTEQSMKSIEKGWDKQPEENRLAFMEKVETGQDVGKENRDLANMYRERLNNAYSTIAQYKDGVNFLENYFPHFWKKPDVVSKDFIPEIMSRRPLEGTKSFLKQRIFQTIQEGIEAGYKPVSTNPETLVQIYEQSVAKFKMAQQIKTDLKANGMWKTIQNGKPLPPGYTYIEDPIARAYFPQGTIQTPTGPQEHFAQAGRAAAPTPVARLINNHLSVDWLGKSPTGRTLMNTKNTLNALQLGFSAFHVTAETLNSIMTGLDVSISKLARGEILGGLKTLAKSPFNAALYIKDGQKFYNGDPELIKIEDDLFAGGASLKKNQYYKNTTLDKFTKNIREGNLPGAFGRLPFAAIEGVNRAIFSQIPKMKIGAFRELFSEELDRKSADIVSGKVTRNTIAREVWNNIENRFGQINYDNLFLSRTFKTSMMLMWRSVGWNAGTIRELGGASTQDFYRFVKDSVHGKKPDLTPKMRYALAILAVTAAFGAIYEKLHTGNGPKTIKDYFYPKNGATDQNGDPVRVQFPTYLKDMYGYSHHIFQTAGNKLSPEFALMMELVQNRDYYGNYVYNPNDSFVKQVEQALSHTAGNAKPFSISNMQQLQKGKADTEEKAESFLGMTKAPADIIQSENTKAVYQNLRTQGPLTPEQQDQNNLKSQYRKQIQQGKIPSFQELKKAGLVTNAVGYRDFIRNSKLTPVERAYKTLPKSTKATIKKP